MSTSLEAAALECTAFPGPHSHSPARSSPSPDSRSAVLPRAAPARQPSPHFRAPGGWACPARPAEWPGTWRCPGCSSGRGCCFRRFLGCGRRLRRLRCCRSLAFAADGRSCSRTHSSRRLVRADCRRCRHLPRRTPHYRRARNMGRTYRAGSTCPEGCCQHSDHRRVHRSRPRPQTRHRPHYCPRKPDGCVHLFHQIVLGRNALSQTPGSRWAQREAVPP
mmetsp:Transcript_18083/g.45717  ORF Transcript_18083/g.45717 Transcript_18083/m.45717 type:complete len:220 (+) Transcript_18083:1033-1692(+)